MILQSYICNLCAKFEVLMFNNPLNKHIYLMGQNYLL